MWPAKRRWSLSSAQRLAIIFCAGLYLGLFWLSSESKAAGAPTVYSGVLSIIVLALLPRGIRLGVVIAIAISSAVLFQVAFYAIGALA